MHTTCPIYFHFLAVSCTIIQVYCIVDSITACTCVITISRNNIMTIQNSEILDLILQMIGGSFVGHHR